MPKLAVLRSAGAPASALAAVITFVTDVLQPLGNFAPWVAGVSLLATIASGVLYAREARKPGVNRMEHPLLGILVLSFGFTLFFSTWAWFAAQGPARGYLAANVEPIAQVQAQLLGLQEDVTQIKQTTQASATVVAVSATAQAQGFKEIQDAFARLSGAGTLAQTPTTPQEWYANARLYQLRGDTANALKAYEGYFNFKLEYVDPYLEYTALLRATDGIARARQAIDDLRRANPNSLALELTAARLFEAPQERLPRLTALAARAPQFGPVFDELGQEYDRALQTTLTNQALQAQQEAYNTLFKLEQQQGFSRYYIDKALADQHLQAAQKMQAAYANASAAFKQVDVQTFFYFNGVQFVIVLPEVFNAKQLLVGIDDPAPKMDTGRTGTGAQTFVNTIFGPVLLPVGEHTLYVQYVDANGVPSAITSKKFRVDPVAVNFTQEPPDFSTNSIPGSFTVGVVGAQVTDTYTYAYSLDSSKLDQSASAGPITSFTVKGLARGDHVLSIRATDAGGKQTPVVQFSFTVK